MLDTTKSSKLVLCLAFRRAVFAIIRQGGVLGIGESFIPVPWSKLGFNVHRDANAVIERCVLETKIDVGWPASGKSLGLTGTVCHGRS